MANYPLQDCTGECGRGSVSPLACRSFCRESKSCVFLGCADLLVRKPRLSRDFCGERGFCTPFCGDIFLPCALCLRGLLGAAESDVGGLFWLDLKREDLLGGSANSITVQHQISVLS